MPTATVNGTPNETAPSIWEMEVPEPGGDYTPCPAGNHPGRVAGLFDVGVHREARKDDKTDATSEVDVRKLVILYELTRKRPDGRPYVMVDRLTWSMHEKAAFFKLVTNLLGAKFQTGQKFDPRTLLGKPVMVSVIHKPGKENKTHANVGGVSQFPEGFPVPAFEHRPVLWSVREGRPLPADAWVAEVRVFGDTIQQLVDASAEGRGPAPAAAAVPAVTPGAGADPIPDGVGPLLAKYRLPWPYAQDQLDRLGSLIAADDLAVLKEVCPIPF